MQSGDSALPALITLPQTANGSFASTCEGEKREESQELQQAENDFELVGQNWFVVLREKGFNYASPD